MPAPAHTLSSATQMPGQAPPQPAQFDPAQLADIHLPDTITFWPVAPGWWLLSIMIVIFLLLIIYLIKRKPGVPAATGKELKSQAMKELQAIRKKYESQTENSNEIAHDTVKKLSIFLRRYALSLRQRDNVASLTDEQWLILLDSINDGNAKSDSEIKPFSQQFANLLTQLPYQSASTPIDRQLLTDLFSASELLIKNSFKRFTAKTPAQKPLAEKKPLAQKKLSAEKKHV